MFAGPWRVTVRGDSVVRVVYQESGDVGDGGAGVPTVDALFDSARTALEYGQMVRICYHARLGYPVTFASNAVGHEWSTVFITRVSKLRPLQ
jgi:hypothetical protein